MGAKGMLGSSFIRLADKSFKVIPASRDDFNFTNFSKLYNFLDSKKPDVIINAAANINLADCEANKESSSKINLEFVKELRDWCANNSSFLVQVSTDHFYDYGGNYPHSEVDEVVLLNEYAKQKFAAERVVMDLDRHLIIRTSILGYRNSGPLTFIEWILSTIKAENQIAGFDDAYTSSIDVDTLVEIVFLCIKNKVKGIYNIASSEVYSKYDLIKAIIVDLGSTEIDLVASKVGQLTPTRADCCGLKVEKIQNLIQIPLPNLDTVVKNLCIQENYNELHRQI